MTKGATNPPEAASTMHIEPEWRKGSRQPLGRKEEGKEEGERRGKGRDQERTVDVDVQSGLLELLVEQLRKADRRTNMRRCKACRDEVRYSERTETKRGE